MGRVAIKTPWLCLTRAGRQERESSMVKIDFLHIIFLFSPSPLLLLLDTHRQSLSIEATIQHLTILQRQLDLLLAILGPCGSATGPCSIQNYSRHALSVGVHDILAGDSRLRAAVPLETISLHPHPMTLWSVASSSILFSPPNLLSSGPLLLPIGSASNGNAHRRFYFARNGWMFHKSQPAEAR